MINDQEVIQLFNKGYSTAKIGKVLNCNPGTVWYCLDRNGLKCKPRSQHFGTLEGRKDELISLFNSGLSAYKISQQTGISKPCVLRLLKKCGCNTSVRSTQRDDKLIDHKDEIINLYNSGLSTCQLRKKFKCGDASVWNLLKNNDVILRDGTKYYVNEYFFDKIDTQEKAYILGFWYADGCVDKKGKLRLALKYDDKYILERIAKIMEYDGPLQYIPPKNKMENSKPQWCLCINRKSLADNLIRLGCVPRKSLILTFPTRDQVPDEFLPHFIRGYFDGDGSFSLKRKTSISAGMTSNDLFLIECVKILKDKINVDFKLYYKKKNKSTATAFIGRREQVERFAQFIYKDSKIHLERKFNKVLKVFPNLSS